MIKWSLVLPHQVMQTQSRTFRVLPIFQPALFHHLHRRIYRSLHRIREYDILRIIITAWILSHRRYESKLQNLPKTNDFRLQQPILAHHWLQMYSSQCILARNIRIQSTVTKQYMFYCVTSNQVIVQLIYKNLNINKYCMQMSFL